jgi:non-canonical purine NTP pyrophosphatase (RdgB/HAM1 family)
VVFESEGVIEGTIADEPRGDKGFGYDPIFYYPPLGVTLGQIERDDKSRISHRGKAFTALREYLTDLRSSNLPGHRTVQVPRKDGS